MNDLYKTRTLLAALFQMVRPRTFLRDTFFNNVVECPTRTVDIDIRKGKRRVAVYVSPTGEGHVSERLGFDTKSYKPPYIKEKRAIEPGDLFDRNPGTTIYTTQTPREREMLMIAQDLYDLDDMITRREEIQASQALFEGEITLRDANEKVTFPMADTHKITSLTHPWDTDLGLPLDDLRGWRRMLIQDSGIAPNIMVGGSDAVAALIDNPQLSGSKGGSLSQVKIERGDISPNNLEDGVTYWGFLKDISCDVYSYDEWYIDPADNTEKAIVPANKVLLGSTKARMDRLYGCIEDLAGMAPMARFPKSWEEEDPSVRYLLMQSAPLLVPHQVDSYMWAEVLS